MGRPASEGRIGEGDVVDVTLPSGARAEAVVEGVRGRYVLLRVTGGEGVGRRALYWRARLRIHAVRRAAPSEAGAGGR